MNDKGEETEKGRIVGTERLALTKVGVCKKDAAEQVKENIENDSKSR